MKRQPTSLRGSQIRGPRLLILSKAQTTSVRRSKARRLASGLIRHVLYHFPPQNSAGLDPVEFRDETLGWSLVSHKPLVRLLIFLPAPFKAFFILPWLSTLGSRAATRRLRSVRYGLKEMGCCRMSSDAGGNTSRAGSSNLSKKACEMAAENRCR